MHKKMVVSENAATVLTKHFGLWIPIFGGGYDPEWGYTDDELEAFTYSVRGFMLNVGLTTFFIDTTYVSFVTNIGYCISSDRIRIVNTPMGRHPECDGIDLKRKLNDFCADILSVITDKYGDIGKKPIFLVKPDNE